MEITYQNGEGRNYLVISEIEIHENEFGLKMLEHRSVAGFLSLKTVRLNGDRKIFYDITSLQPFERLHENRKINGADLNALFAGIDRAWKEAGRYMLSCPCLCFAPALIFADPDTARPHFLYLPGGEERQEKDISELAAFILKNLDHADPEAIRLGYGFYSLVQSPGFSFTDIRERLQGTAGTALGALESRSRGHGGRDFGKAAPPDGQALPPGYENNDMGGFESEQEEDAPGIPPRDREESGYSPDGKKSRFPLFRKNSDRSPADPGDAGVRNRNRRCRTGQAGNNQNGGAVNYGGDPKRAGRKNTGPMRKWIVTGVCMAAVCAWIIFHFEFDLTRAGGLTFLFIAVFWLVHSISEEKKERRRNRWAGEDDDSEDELLEALINDLYEVEAAGGGMNSAPARQSRANETYPENVPGAGDPGFGRETEAQPYTSPPASVIGPVPRPGMPQQVCRLDDIGFSEEEEDGATRILAAGEAGRNFVLVSQNPRRYPDIPVAGGRRIVGKKSGQVDTVISGVDGVSRIHAQLDLEENRLYVTDLNSTNGTFINESRIENSKKCELHQGDTVSFAAASYKVRER